MGYDYIKFSNTKFINVFKLISFMSEALLKQVAEDVRLIREELIELKEEVNDLRDIDLEVRPEYLAKLKKIDSGKFKRFSSIAELRKEIEQD